MPPPRQQQQQQQQQQVGASRAYYLVGALALLFLLGPTVKSLSTPLALNHARPIWWQFATSGLLLDGWLHLAQTAFFVCVFGKAVERLEGSWAMGACFAASSIGAARAWLRSAAAVAGGGRRGRSQGAVAGGGRRGRAACT
jgi:membrane associated rhomboid family serine protease